MCVQPGEEKGQRDLVRVFQYLNSHMGAQDKRRRAQATLGKISFRCKKKIFLIIRTINISESYGTIIQSYHRVLKRKCHYRGSREERKEGWLTHVQQLNRLLP